MTYTDLFSSAIKRFEVAAAVNGTACWNPLGSKAMAQLLKATATQWDARVIEIKRLRKENAELSEQLFALEKKYEDFVYGKAN
jgi:hypothetical protein